MRKRAKFLVRFFRKSSSHRKSDDFWLFFIEVQAEWEADFPERIFHYNYRFSALLKQAVSSLVVYADSNPKWKPDTYTSKSPAGKTGTTFTFDPAKILDFRERRSDLEALVSRKNVAALVVLAQLDAIEAKEVTRRKSWRCARR